MIDKLRRFKESLKINQKFSDININITDSYKNFYYDSFFQHIFSKLTIIIQISFICRIGILEKYESHSYYFINNIILFSLAFFPWKIFSAFYEYLNQVSLLKFLKFMNNKDYFSLGIFQKKIIFISVIYLILFYIPFILLVQISFNAILLNKSLYVQEILKKSDYFPGKNFTNENINFSFSEYLIKNNLTNITFFNQTENILNVYQERFHFETIFKYLENYQYFYFFVLFIKVFSKPIQNIFFTFGYNKFLNIGIVLKFFTNISIFCIFLNKNYNFLLSSLISDFFSEIVSLIFLVIIINKYNPFPQVLFFPDMEFLKLDLNLFFKIFKLNKFIKYFFLNYWNDFLFLIFIFTKICFFNLEFYENKKNTQKISINKNFTFTNNTIKPFPSTQIEMNLDINFLNLELTNFFIFIVLKEFFFNLNKYTKRDSFKDFLEKFQMIDILKKQNLNNSTRVEVVSKKNNKLNEKNKNILSCEEKFDLVYKRKTTEFKNFINKIDLMDSFNKETLLNKKKFYITKNKLNSFNLEKINLQNDFDENSNKNILVVIKSKIFETFIISFFIFVVLLIFKFCLLFDFLFFCKFQIFKISFSFIFILFICGSLNYISNELIILNDFLENPNDKIIINGFILFSFLPFIVLIFFTNNTNILFLVINFVNVYFIYLLSV